MKAKPLLNPLTLFTVALCVCPPENGAKIIIQKEEKCFPPAIIKEFLWKKIGLVHSIN